MRRIVGESFNPSMCMCVCVCVGAVCVCVCVCVGAVCVCVCSFTCTNSLIPPPPPPHLTCSSKITIAAGIETNVLYIHAC